VSTIWRASFEIEPKTSSNLWEGERRGEERREGGGVYVEINLSKILPDRTGSLELNTDRAEGAS
jgi:hypothetical protein